MRYYLIIGTHGKLGTRGRSFALTTRGGPVRFTSLAKAWWYCKHLNAINRRYEEQYRVALLEVKSIDGMELPVFDLFHDNNDSRPGWTKQLVPDLTQDEEARLIAEFERESSLAAV